LLLSCDRNSKGKLQCKIKRLWNEWNWYK
jgi:hypothetical protein